MLPLGIVPARMCLQRDSRLGLVGGPMMCATGAGGSYWRRRARCAPPAVRQPRRCPGRDTRARVWCDVSVVFCACGLLPCSRAKTFCAQVWARLACVQRRHRGGRRCACTCAINLSPSMVPAPAARAHANALAGIAHHLYSAHTALWTRRGLAWPAPFGGCASGPALPSVRPTRIWPTAECSLRRSHSRPAVNCM